VADRFAVPFQAFITNGAVITSDITGRVATAGNTVLTLSTTGGAGTFTITLGSGCTGTVTSGTATITGSVLALSAGANTVTSNGAGNCTLNLTLGTAANTNDVNTYSATSGGVSGASIPTSADNVYFNANSFTAASQVVTVDATAFCKDLSFVGATNTPTLATTDKELYCYGNATFIAAMSITRTANSILYMCGVGNLTTNGVTIGWNQLYIFGGTTTLADNLTLGSALTLFTGSLDTANKVVIAVGTIQHISTGVITLTLGSSNVTCTTVTFTGAGLTLTANTSTINCSGNFSGGGLTTYNTVNLTGATSTITGNNTFATLGFTRAGVQTITATGTTQTATNFVRDAGTSVKTIVNGSFVKAGGGTVDLDYISISGATATPAGTWYAGKNSTNGGTNTGICFNIPKKFTGVPRQLMQAGVI
jgi:hypothetical protein